MKKTTLFLTLIIIMIDGEIKTEKKRDIDPDPESDPVLNSYRDPELLAVRRTQPISNGKKFLQPPMPSCYNGHIANNLIKSLASIYDLV